MYEVSISQKQIKHKGTDSEYTTAETVSISVKTAEEIETILGLFGDTSTITINKITKEDN